MKRLRTLIKYALLGIIIITVAYIVYWAIFPNIAPTWTGFGAYDDKTQGPRAKTLWDWLDLLIVPLALSLGLWLLDRSGKKAEQRLEEDRQKQAVLESYFSFMTELISEDKFYEQTNSRLRAAARVRTLSVLRMLDGERKSQLLQFIEEAGLISKPPLIPLFGADLKDAKLEGATLQDVEIRGAYFNRANLLGANLENADFQASDFSNADLSRVNVKGANFYCATMKSSIIRNTDLRKANIELAELTGSDFTGSTLTNEQRSEASKHKKVILPKSQA